MRWISIRKRRSARESWCSRLRGPSRPRWGASEACVARGVTVRRSARGSRRLSSHSTVLQLVQVFQKIDGLLQSIAFLIEYERQILPALKRVCGSGLLEDDVRQAYFFKIESTEASLNRRRRP